MWYFIMSDHFCYKEPLCPFPACAGSVVAVVLVMVMVVVVVITILKIIGFALFGSHLSWTGRAMQQQRSKEDDVVTGSR